MGGKPIIFSAPMVRALLDGRKTQTRRILNPQPFAGGFHDGDVTLDQVWEAHARFSAAAVGGGAFVEEVVPLRYGIGDRLWVRETWQRAWEADEDGRVRDAMPWRPSIFMPRRYSRITLTVTDVRVQRVQEISDADAIAEGLLPFDGGWASDSEGRCWHPTAAGSFSHLWDMIHGPDARDRDDWVAAYTFTVRHGNIDAEPLP